MIEHEQRPLYDELKRHGDQNPISFHVPGHKNGLLYKGEKGFSQIGILDQTEIADLDDLHDPHGVIYESQQLLTSLYETRKSYFLVNGSTVGNLAMVLGTCEEGDIVIVQRNCHKSVLNALQLAKVNPIFISPEIDKKLHVPVGVDEVLLKKALEIFPQAKAVILTYPNYYGQTTSLGELIKLAHEHNLLVMIDEAHGAHFQLGDPFPDSSLKYGADIVIHSAHKTLPAMTMGSYLHINTDRVNIQKVEKYLSILQSSSPSYPIMASLDYARSFLGQFTQEDIQYTIEQIRYFKGELGKIANLRVIKTSDPIKLVIRHPSLSGYDVQKKLEGIGIFPELADPFQVLLVFPLLKKEMAPNYIQAINRMRLIDWSVPLNVGSTKKMINRQMIINSLALPYSEMDKLSVKWVKLEETIGKIAAKMVIPYPPGIPLLLQGESITKEHIDELKRLMVMGARFQGDSHMIQQGKIAVYNEDI